MKKHHIIFSVAAIVLLCTSAAHADDRNRNANFFLTLGRTFVKDGDFKDEMTGLKFGTGYRFSEYAGFELFYIYYGEISERDNIGNSSTLKASALVFNAIAAFPLNSLFDLYAKVGISKWDAELEFLNVTAKTDGTDPVFTLGFGYNIDHDSTIRFEYERSDYDNAKFSVISFGFQHNF